MPPPDKKPIPQKDPPPSKPPIADPPKDPSNQTPEIDVDDAMIEKPKDDAFKGKASDEDNTTNRLKERDELSKEGPRLPRKSA